MGNILEQVHVGDSFPHPVRWVKVTPADVTIADALDGQDVGTYIFHGESTPQAVRYITGEGLIDEEVGTSGNEAGIKIPGLVPWPCSVVAILATGTASAFKGNNAKPIYIGLPHSLPNLRG